MPAEKSTIFFSLVYKGQDYQVHTYRNQYYSVMTLIADHLAIDGFGICCGMGSCGTCRVNIREHHSPASRSVLACDLRVDDSLSHCTIEIPANLYTY